MHTEGHIGIMAMAYSPVAFILLITNHYSLAIIGAICLLLWKFPMIPDFDMYLPIKHRGWTHSIWAALFFTLTNGIAIWTLTHNILYTLFASYIGFMWIFGHVLGDMITKMGVKPLYPFHDYWVRIEISIFGLPTTANNNTANKIFFILGTLSLSTTLFTTYYFGINL